MLALLGLYQLDFTAVKPHAAVSETVAAAYRKTWAKPLLNAILRGYQRERESYNSWADSLPVGATAYPQWLLDQIESSWPQQFDKIQRRGNDQPPMTLRVNCSKVKRDEYLENLRKRDITATISGVSESAITLNEPLNVHQIPGFSEGSVSVQDEAAQLAAFLLNPQGGERVLDACAAPGSKSTHILERCPKLAELVAVDIDPIRLHRIDENLQRLGTTATLIVGDVSSPSQWWNGRKFHRILVDVPCSATGVIRRHPDIKILRRPEDIGSVVKTQKKILTALWPLLNEGGVILYATCSILKAENEQQMEWFFATHQDAERVPINASWGVIGTFGRQIATGESGMDGFYYALIRKQG